jgi:thiazole synthase
MSNSPYWNVGGQQLSSRFLLGTAQYPSLDILNQCVDASKTQILTVALQRAAGHQGQGLTGYFWDWLKSKPLHLLPNTAGARSAKEAIEIALMSREVFQTHWIKLEVTSEETYLSPHCLALIEAARVLVSEGFCVFPYMTEDLRIAEELLQCGVHIFMPWASPIGSGQGLLYPEGLRRLRRYFPEATLIVDAGIGSPSQACQVMEWGFDGVLCNTAISQAFDPVMMATAFRNGIEAGRLAYQAGIMPERSMAVASTILSSF